MEWKIDNETVMVSNAFHHDRPFKTAVESALPKNSSGSDARR
jgi:hypothetical protein